MRLVAVSILKVETVLSSAEEQPWTLVWGRGLENSPGMCKDASRSSAVCLVSGSEVSITVG